MSELDNILKFEEMEDDDDFDINVIFGDSAVSDEPPPVPEAPPAIPMEPQPQPAVAEPSAETAEQPPAENEEKAETAPAPKTETEPDLFSLLPGAEPKNNEQKTAPPAEQKKEAANTQVSLFDKPPVFSYGSAKEKIEDASMTFEELRIAKADDFPELGEGKRVSWRVKYGDVTKTVSGPAETTIAKFKADIEKSKAFLDALKKGKVKDPDCLVTPIVTAQSKGIAEYKGVFPTVEAARQSDKVICLIPARDGRIYEMRKTDMGEVVAPKANIVEFSDVRAGFRPALPPIPRELMGQIISFFRSFMGHYMYFEAMVHIFWDKENEEFVVSVPKQKTTHTHIAADLQDYELDEERYVFYADVHSHNSMEAAFSHTDDNDEKATRLYVVIGRLDRFYPEIKARVSCGGNYLEIDPNFVIEGVGEEFPPEWRDRVETVDLAEYHRQRARCWRVKQEQAGDLL